MRPPQEDWLLRGLFLAVALVCALTIAVGGVGLARQTHLACQAANRSLKVQAGVWRFTELTVEQGWRTAPPSATVRRSTKAFFAGVQDRLKPVKC